MALLACAPHYPQSSPEMGPMRYQNWKTVCLGRYLVDVPEGIEINYFATFRNYRLNDARRLERVPGLPADAKKMAAAKVREFQAQPHETKGTLYIRSISLPNGGVLVQGWQVSFATRASEAFLYIPLTIQGKSFVYTYHAETISSSKEQQQLRDLVAFASSLRPLPKGVIPEEDGLCFGDIMFVGVPDAFVDDLAFNFKDPHAKGLTIAFAAETALSEFRWLTKRPEWAGEECRLMGGKKKCDKLRFGKHPVGPIQGEELCLAGRTYDGKYRMYNFTWQNPGVPNSKTSPRLTASLSYRGIPREYPTAPIPFSTEAEALATWDRFVNSIRVRPIGQ